MKIEAIKTFLARYDYFDESKALYEFFRTLPDDLDLDSAKYYLLKEFRDQSAGYDESSFEPVNEEGESWYDSALDDDEDEDIDEDYDPDYCEQCNDYHDAFDYSGYDDEDDEDDVWCSICQEWVNDDH